MRHGVLEALGDSQLQIGSEQSAIDIALVKLDNRIAICLFRLTHTFSLAPFPDLHPRPANGIFVAITFMNSTFASSGKLAI